LSNTGILIATIPLGYNPSFDRDLFENKLKCNRVIYLRRIAMDVWVEASQEEVAGSQYGKDTGQWTDGHCVYGIDSRCDHLIKVFDNCK